jgi:hypothetical protein
MNKQTLIILAAILIFPIIVSASDGKFVKVKPIDCGPLSRDEFGVVFSAYDKNELRTYFVKGRAHFLCPKIMEADFVVGEVLNLCRNYTPPDPRECGAVQEFILKGTN